MNGTGIIPQQRCLKKMNEMSNRLYMHSQGTGENATGQAWLGIPSRQIRIDNMV